MSTRPADFIGTDVFQLAGDLVARQRSFALSIVADAQVGTGRLRRSARMAGEVALPAIREIVLARRSRTDESNLKNPMENGAVAPSGDACRSIARSMAGPGPLRAAGA